MNILLTNISVLPPPEKKEPLVYHVMVPDCDTAIISAAHTNESMLKCFAELNEIKHSNGLNRIIALVSNKAKVPNPFWDNLSAIGYYKNIVKECYPFITPEIIELPIENESNDPIPTEELLANICAYIRPEDKVYIDSAGGQRTISNLVQLLTKILIYIGVDKPCALYSDINNTPIIVDTDDFSRMANLADAFNEFMTSGKSDQLRFCFKNPTPEVEVLLNAMCEFSGKIRLGDLTALNNTINELRRGISKCKAIKDNTSLEIVVLRQFLPVIEKKLFSDGEGADYLKIIQWCLDNALIQQALTVFTEKAPCFLFENGVVVYKGDVGEAKTEYQKEHGVMQPTEWEAYALYSEIMEPNSDYALEMLFDQFKSCLITSTNASDKRVADALAVVRLHAATKYERPIVPKTSNPNEKELVDFINRNTFLNYEGLCKSLVSGSNPSFVVKKLLGFDDYSTLNTLQKKFKAVDLIRKGKHNLQNFKISVDKETIVGVLYAYLYVKATRNKINHASSEENLDADQQDILASYGYHFDHYDLETVRRNIQIALNSFIAAVDEVPKTKHIKTIVRIEPPVVLGKIDLDSIK